MSERALETLAEQVATCRRCPRLVAWREEVATNRRRAFAEQEYWGRGVPGWGDPEARCLIVGLAPAAHGANRTGRMFTGDESGRWLYRALHRFEFASQAEATTRDDGLELRDCYMTAVARCAPPANRLLPVERENCRPFLERELDLLHHVRVIVSLGQVAFDQVLRIHRQRGADVPVPKPRFGHGVEVQMGSGSPLLLASYHPSQQNTFTGTLTEAMLDDIFRTARAICQAA